MRLAWILPALVALSCGGSSFLEEGPSTFDSGGREPIATGPRGGADAGSTPEASEAALLPETRPPHDSAPAQEADATAIEAAAPAPEAGQDDATATIPDVPCVRRNQCDGENCGDKDDGCGGHWHCGDCTGTDLCNAHVCSPCEPTTCEALGAYCGPRPDGCGKTLNCGDSCPLNTTCGGGTDPNVCGPWTDRCFATPANDRACVILTTTISTWHAYCPQAVISARNDEGHACDWQSIPSCGGYGYVCGP